MQLPNKKKAYIPAPKIYNYLLSSTHEVGKAKAKFFSQLGFTKINADLLEVGLLLIARTQNVIRVSATMYGTKYIIDGKLVTPTNNIVNVRTVWIIEIDDERPRFVTAHPLPK